jgi:uncharacterized protein (TIGR00730 family)
MHLLPISSSRATVGAMALHDRPLDAPVPVENDRASRLRTDDPAVVAQIDALLKQFGADAGDAHTRHVRDIVQTALRLASQPGDLGELKVMANSLKEMRYGFSVFGRYKQPHKITIFGSARTPEDHPDFTACVEFSKLMADAGWMAITGAGMGIMKAGNVGPGRDASFGVSIRLPFETNANQVIEGDEKLINFRYFFTRKLMFVSQCEAVALFPGGFGTMDEAFETMTLVQTGKAQPMPIVLVEGKGGDYWRGFDHFLREHLLKRGWISSEDPSLYYIARDAQDAAKHVLAFFRNYHSSRYVREQFVIRMQRPLQESSVRTLEKEFGVLIKEGGLRQCGPLEGEEDNLHLPRLAFHHTKHKYGKIRMMIDRINEME